MTSSVFHTPEAILRGEANLCAFKNSAMETVPRAAGNIIFSPGKSAPLGAGLLSTHLLQSSALPGPLGQNSHKFQRTAVFSQQR